MIPVHEFTSGELASSVAIAKNASVNKIKALLDGSEDVLIQPSNDGIAEKKTEFLNTLDNHRIDGIDGVDTIEKCVEANEAKVIIDETPKQFSVEAANNLTVSSNE